MEADNPHFPLCVCWREGTLSFCIGCLVNLLDISDRQVLSPHMSPQEDFELWLQLQPKFGSSAFTDVGTFDLWLFLQPALAACDLPEELEEYHLWCAF